MPDRERLSQWLTSLWECVSQGRDQDHNHDQAAVSGAADDAEDSDDMFRLTIDVHDDLQGETAVPAVAWSDDLYAELDDDITDVLENDRRRLAVEYMYHYVEPGEETQLRPMAQYVAAREQSRERYETVGSAEYSSVHSSLRNNHLSTLERTDLLVHEHRGYGDHVIERGPVYYRIASVLDESF